VTRRRWRIALAAATVALAATALPTGRLRHLALPVVHDPSVRSDAARLDIADGAIGEATERTQLPTRISAILPLPDGVVFIGTFDGGLFRFDPARDTAPREIAALDGRERFVDALAEWNGHVVAATHRGAVVLAPDGARAGILAAGQAVSSLAVAGNELVLGTAHGLWRGRDDVAVGERGPDGETLRVTALAATGDHVWIGTPDGVYEVRAPLHAQAALWHPLVFGSPGASSNVVTALALSGDGVVAGTDDGGLVFVDDRGVDARPFADRRANDINPGALVALDGRVFAGSEGAGLVALDATRAHARRVGPLGRISAVAVTRSQILFGSEEGALYVTPSPRPGSSG
jgi:ligand-binding sensor domain-containing protein